MDIDDEEDDKFMMDEPHVTAQPVQAPSGGKNNNGSGKGSKAQPHHISDLDQFFMDIELEEREMLQAAIAQDDIDEAERYRQEEEMARVSGTVADDIDVAHHIRNMDVVNLTREDVHMGASDNFRFFTAATCDTWQRVDTDEIEELCKIRQVALADAYFRTEIHIPYDLRHVAVINDYCRDVVQHGFGKLLRFITLNNSKGAQIVVAQFELARSVESKAVMSNVVFMVDEGAIHTAQAMDRTGRFLNFYIEHSPMSYEKAAFLSRSLSDTVEDAKDAPKPKKNGKIDIANPGS